MDIERGVLNMVDNNIEFKDIDINIIKGRWSMTIIIKHKNGKTEKYIASADRGITDGDGIFFGTEKEYNDIINNYW